MCVREVGSALRVCEFFFFFSDFWVFGFLDLGILDIGYWMIQSARLGSFFRKLLGIVFKCALGTMG